MSGENDELPVGWKSAKVADLIAKDGMFSDGDWVESKDQDPDGSIRLLQLADVGDGRFVDKSSRFVNEEKFEKLRCTEVLEGDVLIARMPDPLGRACLAPKLKQKSITVVDVAIVRPGRKSADPAWLMHVINSPEIRQQMELESTGSTRKRIARGKIANIELPVPPLAEQKRIADKLEAVLGKVDACRARLDRVPALLKRFRQSVLAAATSGKLTEEWRRENGVNEEWQEKQIRDLGSVQLGRQRSPKYHNGANMRPYLRVQNVFEARLDLSDVMTMEFGEADFERYRLSYGDILLNEGQSPQYLGRPAMFRDEIPDACFTNTLIRFRANQQILNRKYALLVFRHYMHCGRFAQEGSITTNIAHLGAGRFAEVEFKLPSLIEQQEIVRRVEDLFAFADRIEARLIDAQKTIERLTPATLAIAFRGELVPQDPADEPVAALLERISQEPQINPAKSSRRGRAKGI